jgi:hypothetical protein
MKSLQNVFLSVAIIATGMRLFQPVDLQYGLTLFEEETAPRKLPTQDMQSHFEDLPTNALNHYSSKNSSTPFFWHVPKSEG